MVTTRRLVPPTPLSATHTKLLSDVQVSLVHGVPPTVDRAVLSLSQYPLPLRDSEIPPMVGSFLGLTDAVCIFTMKGSEVVDSEGTQGCVLAVPVHVAVKVTKPL